MAPREKGSRKEKKSKQTKTMTHPIEVQGGRGLEEKPQRNLASQAARSQPAHKHCCLGTESAPPDSAKCPSTFSSQGYVEGCLSCCSSEAGGPARSRDRGTGPAAKQGSVGKGRASRTGAAITVTLLPLHALPNPPGHASPDTWCISHVSARTAQLSQAPHAGGGWNSSCHVCQAASQRPSPKEHIFLLTSQRNSLF